MEIYSLEDMQQAELTVTMPGEALTVSIFLMDGLLIDTGPFRKRRELVSLFKQWDIDQVVLTHHHEDHTGLGYWFDQETDIPLYMHASGIDICKKRVSLPPYRRLFWGKQLPFHAEPLGSIVYTDRYGLEVIHTPGHAHDHIALYHKEKGWMFGGDLYVSPRPKSMYRFESVPEMIHSLRTLIKYDFDVYIDSHAGVIFNGKKLLQKKLDYLLTKQQEVFFLHNKGMPVKQIRKELFPKRHFMHYISLFENSPKHFVTSILNGF